jgi:hypothetical protein
LGRGEGARGSGRLLVDGVEVAFRFGHGVGLDGMSGITTDGTDW